MRRQVVVVAIIVRDGRILLTQRSGASDFPFLWESPGGKVEPGEELDAALLRELREELGVGATTGGTLFTEDFDPPISPRPIRVIGMRVEIHGTPRPLVAHDLRWFGPEAIRSLPMVPANSKNRDLVIGLLNERGDSDEVGCAPSA